MEKGSDDGINAGMRELCIRPEDVLEFIYEVSDKWKNMEDPIGVMREDLRLMIRYFKEEKFDKLQEEFKIDL